jgi:haloalkane dehalogenase|tara:strand:+ start:4170 stop:5111 length:942 start_codon:yes stop_codon:yes gene_type:complete
MVQKELKPSPQKENLNLKENEMTEISVREPEKKNINVLGKKMTYVDKGEGDPIIFQHGNPASSYLWRNIIPYLENQGRCIAIDLIGMGDSDKLTDNGNNTYSYHIQKQYFDKCLEELEIKENITFVIHDWGSALGFNWAYEHQESVKGICYMEAIVKKISWEDWPKDAKSIFQGFRSDAGEDLILKKNLFIEGVLPNAIIRNLTETEMDIYRKPFLKEIDRRPTLDWPRQIPINNEPEDVCKIVDDYSSWMSINEIPKLFINADPGSILTGKQREFCRKWKNQQELTVKGNHFIQEDSPNEIGEAISKWYRNL